MSGTGILSSRGIFNQQQCVYVYSYCLIGNNGRLQHLRFCLLKCMLIIMCCHKMCEQCSEFHTGQRTALNTFHLSFYSFLVHHFLYSFINIIN